jgi:hypothetical protein
LNILKLDDKRNFQIFIKIMEFLKKENFSINEKLSNELSKEKIIYMKGMFKKPEELFFKMKINIGSLMKVDESYIDDYSFILKNLGVNDELTTFQIINEIEKYHKIQLDERVIEEFIYLIIILCKRVYKY